MFESDAFRGRRAASSAPPVARRRPRPYGRASRTPPRARLRAAGFYRMPSFQHSVPAQGRRLGQPSSKRLRGPAASVAQREVSQSSQKVASSAAKPSPSPGFPQKAAWSELGHIPSTSDSFFNILLVKLGSHACPKHCFKVIITASSSVRMYL